MYFLNGYSEVIEASTLKVSDLSKKNVLIHQLKGCSYPLVDELTFKSQAKIQKLQSISVNDHQDIEELIADSMTGLMIRAERLNEFDQLAISEEFREWLNDGVRLEDVLKLVTIQK